MPLAFAPVDGGVDRACATNFWGDYPDMYTLHTDIHTMSACQSLCDDTCAAIEYSPDLDNGHCKVWSRSALEPMDHHGIWDEIVSFSAAGSTCLRHDTTGVGFQAVNGGIGQACRGSDTKDSKPQYYKLLVGISSVYDCEESCVTLPECVAIEYNPNGRCELWTRVVHATEAKEGYSCWEMDDFWRGRRLIATSSTRPKAGFLAPSSTSASNSPSTP
jgi:hypothetical protein